MEVPLDRISDVKFGQSIFERLVGAGNLTIESAAEFGEQRFDYIRRPEEVQRVPTDGVSRRVARAEVGLARRQRRS